MPLRSHTSSHSHFRNRFHSLPPAQARALVLCMHLFKGCPVPDSPYRCQSIPPTCLCRMPLIGRISDLDMPSNLLALPPIRLQYFGWCQILHLMVLTILEILKMVICRHRILL